MEELHSFDTWRYFTKVTGPLSNPIPYTVQVGFWTFCCNQPHKWLTNTTRSPNQKVFTQWETCAYLSSKHHPKHCVVSYRAACLEVVKNIVPTET